MKGLRKKLKGIVTTFPLYIMMASNTVFATDAALGTQEVTAATQNLQRVITSLAIPLGSVIIFTAIYLNKKNKIKMNIQKRKGKKKLNNLWGIDDIRNEVIVSNNKKTIIMRIGSIDYHLLSAKEQNALETNLVEIAKTIKYPMQLFCTKEFIDTTEVIKEIKK